MTFHWSWAAVGLLIAVAGGAEARHRKTQTGFLFETLNQDGREYKYAVYVPREYDSHKDWPIILFLHGSGESGTDGAKQVIQGVGSAMLWDIQHWPFIVIFPQKPSSDSEWEQHEPAVMEMLARARKDYSVD